MRKWCLKFLSFATVSIFLLLAVLLFISNHVKKKRFHFYETDSNFLVLNSNEEFDYIFTGISHARNFSRHKNHIRVENILAAKIANLGQGGATTSAAELLFYQQMFYRRGNKNHHLVYFISPPLFYASQLRVASNSFNREPFELDFLFHYLFFNSENKQQRLLSYVQSKLTLNWFNMKPESMDSLTESLSSIDYESVEKGLKTAYEVSDSVFDIEKQIIEKTIDLSLSKNEQVTLILPPVLFKKWHGQDKVISFAREQCRKKGVSFYDFSEAVTDPKYYYDHHHMNSRGISYFTEKYLSKVLIQ